MLGDGIDVKDEVCSFLLIGQSNMAGRGNLGEVPPIDNPDCLMLRMGRWQKMSEPINPDRPLFEGRFCSGVGLSASFSDLFQKTTGKKVGLIPCADGGTRIEQWQPDGVLFDHAVSMTRLAQRSSRLCGILWHQGESNCRQFNREEYRRLFLNTMTALRRELGAEEVPLVIGELSEEIVPSWGMVAVPQMNLLLNEMPKELPLCGIASSKGLPLKEDGLHFSSVALRELGRRYFEEYKTLASL